MSTVRDRVRVRVRARSSFFRNECQERDSNPGKTCHDVVRVRVRGRLQLRLRLRHKTFKDAMGGRATTTAPWADEG